MQGLHSPRVPDVSHHVTGAPILPCVPPPSACTSIFLCPRASAGVANHSIHLWPPPGQLARGLGSWEGAGYSSGERRCLHVCSEAGARVTTNILVRDLEIRAEPNAADGRRLGVIADGLPLCGGPQLAIDTTLVGTPPREWLAQMSRCGRSGPASSETSQRA